jgi:Glycosyl transferases group 1
MKIFLSFLQSDNNYPIPAYSFWQHYIKNGINEVGYQWEECPDADWALGLVPQDKDAFSKWKQDTWGKTVEYLKKHPADLFLSYLYPQQIDESAINEIKKTGTPCVNFFCDHIREFKKLPAEFAVFNLNWVPEYKAINLYKKSGYPYINLPMPMWVEPKYRVLKEETNSQVTFIGSKDIQRKLLFEKVIEQEPGLPLTVYGNGWNENNIPQQSPLPDYTLDKKIMFNLDLIKSQGVTSFLRKIIQRNITNDLSEALKSKIRDFTTVEQYNTLTAESMITLGVNRYPSFRFPITEPDSYSRLRDIEAPMLGACYLTEYTEGLENLYNIGNEIEVYKNSDDFIEKVKELQGDSSKRKRLKIKGQKRALNDHNISNSINRVLKEF